MTSNLYPIRHFMALAILVCSLMPVAELMAQNLQWARAFSGTANEQGFAITTDAAGNVYTTGAFAGTVDFDPGAGVTNFTAGVASDAFISKVDASGNLVWAKHISTVNGGAFGYAITLDVNGNVLVAGGFSGTADFDPGPGTSIISNTSFDAFVLKLDNAGSLVWVKTWGDFDADVAYGIATDAQGNVYSTGYYTLTVDMDPGPNIAYLKSVENSRDVFVSKLDASGNYVWARTLGGAGDERGYAIAADADFNVYIHGYFSGTADFDPLGGINNITSNGGGDVFVTKLSSSGLLVWTKAWGGTLGDEGRSMVLDNAGNIVTTGYFQNTVDFDPGAAVSNISSTGSGDIFVSKLDKDGNYLWAKKIGGTNYDVGLAITTDGAGNIYPAGNFRGTVDFDPGPANTNSVANGVTEIFFLKLDAAGNYAWSRTMGSAGNEEINAITIGYTGAIHATGRFQSTADFDPNAGVSNITAAGGDDIFVAKYDGGISLPVRLLSFTGQCQQANVMLMWTTAAEENSKHFVIERSTDAQQFAAIGTVAAAGNSQQNRNYVFIDKQPVGGQAYYRLKQVDADGFTEFSANIALGCQRPAGLKLYPNPATSHVRIDGTAAGGHIIITNMNGQVVLRANTTAGITQLGIEKLAAGVYSVQLTDGSKVQQLKLTKQ